MAILLYPACLANRGVALPNLWTSHHPAPSLEIDTAKLPYDAELVARGIVSQHMASVVMDCPRFLVMATGKLQFRSAGPRIQLTAEMYGQLT